MRRDDCQGLFVGDVVAEVVGIVSGIGKHVLGAQPIEQRMGLGDVVPLSAGEQEPHRQPQAAHHQMDLAGQAATRAADRLILRPPFAPGASWCARTMVESMIAYSKSGSYDRGGKILCHTPLWLHQ